MDEIKVTLTRENSFPATFFFTENFSVRLSYQVSLIHKARQTVPTKLTRHTTLETGLFALAKAISPLLQRGWVFENKASFDHDVNHAIQQKQKVMSEYLALATGLIDGESLDAAFERSYASAKEGK